MNSTATRAALLLSAIVAFVPRQSVAATVDGRLDLEYGTPLATQTTQTSFVDANPVFSPDPIRYADGSELDAVFGYIADGTLHLLLAGNLGFCCPSMFSHQEEFDIFIDSKPGGQQTLRADNAAVGCCGGSALNGLAGLTFDPGFEPDYWLGCTVNMFSSFAELLTGGGGTGYDLGYNTTGAPGTLTGGTNPYGILAAVDNSNGAGVGHGCGAASGDGVTTGVEWAVPLAALGDQVGCFRVCVLAKDAMTHALGNQLLGPVPPGTCALGAPAGVDLRNVPGSQYVTICALPTATRVSRWGSIKSIYR